MTKLRLSRRTGKEIECIKCEKTFYVARWEVKQGRKFCSKKCQETGKILSCRGCSENFYASAWDINRGRKYCSHLCGERANYKGIYKISEGGIRQASQFEKAYFAGFFDGEGYVGCYGTSKEHRAVRVSIGQKNGEILDLAQSIWGGSRYHSVDKRNGRTHERWEIRSKKATLFLEDILPYVHVKKSQVQLALEYQSTMQFSGKKLSQEIILRRQSITNAIKRLNSPMGWGIGKEAQN